jgi:hypothetical protein
MQLIARIIFLLFLSFSIAQAQMQTETEFDELSPRKARNLSLFLTLGSITFGSLLVAADSDGAVGGFGALNFWMGSIFFPGAGYIYSHHGWDLWRGVLIRLAGTGLMVTAFAISWDDPDASGGWEFFIAGGAVFLGSAII